jgi:hypothetical protein
MNTESEREVNKMAYEFYWKASFMGGCMTIPSPSNYGEYTKIDLWKAKKAFRSKMRETGLRKVKIEQIKINYTE